MNGSELDKSIDPTGKATEHKQLCTYYTVLKFKIKFLLQVA